MRAFTLATLSLLVAASQAAPSPASNDLAAQCDEANNMAEHVARDPLSLGKGSIQGAGFAGDLLSLAASRSQVNGGLALCAAGIVVALGM